MSEVTVENQDEGSSNEGSDDDGSDDEDDDESHSETPYRLPSMFTGAASLADVDLDALIHGPTSQSKSVVDDIPSRSVSDDDEEAEVDILEDDDDDDRRYRHRSRKDEKYAPSEDEGEDSDIPDSDVPAEVGSRAERGDEVESVPTELSIKSNQLLEDASGTTQAGSHGPCHHLMKLRLMMLLCR
jgi:hypothetical protein